MGICFDYNLISCDLHFRMSFNNLLPKHLKHRTLESIDTLIDNHCWGTKNYS